MKVRIKDNSIRFRLTKSDVEKLSTQLYIQSKIEFNSMNLFYEIKVTDNNFMNADFENNVITLYMPKVLAQSWFTNDIITHENTVTLLNGRILKLLLEKDFVCLDHTTEDQSDNYANPNKTC